MPLLDRIRQRKLFQWSIAYLAGAWLLLQVIGLLGGFFDWSDAAGRIATVILAVGFFAALVLAHGITVNAASSALRPWRSSCSRPCSDRRRRDCLRGARISP